MAKEGMGVRAKGVGARLLLTWAAATSEGLQLRPSSQLSDPHVAAWRYRVQGRRRTSHCTTWPLEWGLARASAVTSRTQ
eukprot:4499644-Amphidinium_carterae.1